MKNIFTRFKQIVPFLVIAGVVLGCSKLKETFETRDRLYFCERYISTTDKCEGESTKFTTGALTVMVKLTKPIGETDVNINITDLSTGEVAETIPFTVSSDMDYIYFDDVGFDEPGKYRVSLLKKEGTVIVSNEIEIISR